MQTIKCLKITAGHVQVNRYFFKYSENSTKVIKRSFTRNLRPGIKSQVWLVVKVVAAHVSVHR